MEMTRRASLGVLTAAGLAAVLGGCAGTAAPEPATPVSPRVAETRGVADTEPAADPAPFGAADTAFGLDVLRAWSAGYPGQNLVFSPSTLSSSLGLAYLGARGATAAVMARVLHLPAETGAELAAGLQARSKALAGLNGPGVTLSASQRVWADPSVPPLGSYLNAVATGYGAGLTTAPFASSPAAAASEINRAISADTRGHITKLITPAMLKGVGWVLTSALYLDAVWATAFNRAATVPGPFTLADGSTVTASYLNGSDFAFATAGGWTAVDLPYRGGKLTMTALLPPAGSPPGALPTRAGLAALTGALAGAGRSVRSTAISLPKVSLSVNGPTGNMERVLTALGMGQAFTRVADFTGLSALAGSMTFVQQAATLRVAESGTVAAAAAAAGISFSSVEARTTRFDRPYLLLVSARATGEPLFLAAVANPAAS
jgi:serine protease inhibitor